VWEIHQRLVPQQGTARLFAQLQLAETLAGCGQFAEAEPLARQALQGLRQRPDGAAYVPLAEGMLGQCLRAQKRYEEAEKLLLASHQRIARLTGPDAPQLLGGAVASLVQLYEAWGKPKEAALWKARLPARPAGGGP
jgi:hypothetical protein